MRAAISAFLGARGASETTTENRSWERFPCGLTTTCQPVAARGGSEFAWPAQIRDLSQAGMGILLNRRFEPGTGLAIEVPETDAYPGDTLLCRVVHATRWDDKWLLGCVLVSPLSEEEMERLLGMGQVKPAGSADDCYVQEETLHQASNTRLMGPPSTKLIISEVQWEGPGADGKPIKRLYRNLNLTGSWPLAPGTCLEVWTGLHPELKSHVVVDRCFQHGTRWIVRFYIPDDEP